MDPQKTNFLIKLIVGDLYNDFIANKFISRAANFDEACFYIDFFYNKHRNMYLKQMKNGVTELDKHRQAACIVAALLDAQILKTDESDSNLIMYYHPNEVLAAYSALTHIHYVMAASLCYQPKGTKYLSVVNFVRTFEPMFPETKDDEGDYFSSLVNVLYRERERAHVNPHQYFISEGNEVSVGTYNYTSLSNIFYFYDLFISKQIKKELSRTFDNYSRVIRDEDTAKIG